MPSRNFREYRIWNEAVEMASFIYSVTDELPYFEQKGLCDQLRRAAVSISSNIAEGCGMPTDVGFARFLDIALGSSYEVETQLLISKNVGYISIELYNEILTKIQDLERQITALISKIRQSESK